MNSESILKAAQTAFIDNGITSNPIYRSQFVSNDFKEGKKVLSTIEKEFSSCDEFIISVAFITMSGLTPLLQTLKELEDKGVKGKILTTDYLYFSEPRALDKLAEFNNIELRMYCSDESSCGFHTKGYIFKSGNVYSMIIGSSNMTISALTKNKEWNSRIVSTTQGEYAQQVLNEFDLLWMSKNTKNYIDYIDFYKQKYAMIQEQKRIASESVKDFSLSKYYLEPNDMQVHFVQNLLKLKSSGEQKALLISATGTGKTYASAFAVRELGFKKILFVVHRNQIAKQAMRSFQKVFNNKVSMGLVTGRYQNYDAD